MRDIKDKVRDLFELNKIDSQIRDFQIESENDRFCENVYKSLEFEIYNFITDKLIDNEIALASLIISAFKIVGHKSGIKKDMVLINSIENTYVNREYLNNSIVVKKFIDEEMVFDDVFRTVYAYYLRLNDMKESYTRKSISSMYSKDAIVVMDHCYNNKLIDIIINNTIVSFGKKDNTIHGYIVFNNNISSRDSIEDLYKAFITVIEYGIFIPDTKIKDMKI